MCPFSSPDYIAEHGLPLHPQDLQQHHVLSILGRPLRFIADVPEIRPNSPVLVNNVSWLRRFALAGMGIAALSSDMARPEVAKSALLPILPDLHLPKVKATFDRKQVVARPRATVFGPLDWPV